MADNPFSDAETRTSTASADDIIREAEARKSGSKSGDETRETSGRPLADDPAPLSEALGIPTLLNPSKPERDASTQYAEDGSRRADHAETKKSGSEIDSDFFVSSEVGLPLLSDNPTPLSSALKIPTLINESKPAR